MHVSNFRNDYVPAPLQIYASNTIQPDEVEKITRELLSKLEKFTSQHALIIDPNERAFLQDENGTEIVAKTPKSSTVLQTQNNTDTLHTVINTLKTGRLI